MKKNMLEVKIINKSKNPLPKYEVEDSAGMDLRANIEEIVVLKPMERKLIPTGLHILLPKGYEAQIRPRSGLAIKHGITCLNTPGTVDSSYIGDIGVILINLSTEDFTIEPGDRIAQMVVAKHEQVDWVPVEELKSTERGEGGFGHSGVK